MKTEKKIVDMSKEERMRVKGLNGFIAGADTRARKEFKEICIKLNSPWNEELEHIFAAGYLKCLNDLTLQLS